MHTLCVFNKMLEIIFRYIISWVNNKRRGMSYYVRVGCALLLGLKLRHMVRLNVQLNKDDQRPYKIRQTCKRIYTHYMLS